MVPAWATDPSSEKWSSLKSQNALFGGSEPTTKLFPATQWGVNLPLKEIVSLQIKSGTGLRTQYEESGVHPYPQQQGTLYTWAQGRLDYQTHSLALRLQQKKWHAQLHMLHHSLELQANGSLEGDFSETPLYHGHWDASYSGTAWTPGILVGLSWIEIALDFSAQVAITGTQEGLWQIPQWADPLTGTPNLSETPTPNAPLQTQQRSGKDTLQLALPKQVYIALRPSSHLVAEYRWRRGAFALQHSPRTDPWDWTHYIHGELYTGHQMLFKSPWEYGYGYIGAQWLHSEARWSAASHLLPQGTVLPQAGLGITLGKPYRVLAGAELLPAVRLIFGVQYAP